MSLAIVGAVAAEPGEAVPTIRELLGVPERLTTFWKLPEIERVNTFHVMASRDVAYLMLPPKEQQEVRSFVVHGPSGRNPRTARVFESFDSSNFDLADLTRDRSYYDLPESDRLRRFRECAARDIDFNNLSETDKTGVEIWFVYQPQLHERGTSAPSTVVELPYGVEIECRGQVTIEGLHEVVTWWEAVWPRARLEYAQRLEVNRERRRPGETGRQSWIHVSLAAVVGVMGLGIAFSAGYCLWYLFARRRRHTGDLPQLHRPNLVSAPTGVDADHGLRAATSPTKHRSPVSFESAEGSGASPTEDGGERGRWTGRAIAGVAILIGATVLGKMCADTIPLAGSHHGAQEGNPFSQESPLYLYYENAIARVTAMPEYQERSSGRAGVVASFTSGMDLTNSGLRRLDDSMLERRLVVMSAVLENIGTSACGVNVRGDRARAFEAAKATITVIESLDEGLGRDYVDLVVEAMCRELRGYPVREVDGEAIRGALTRLLSSLPASDGHRLAALLQDLSVSSDEEACWAGRTLYRQALLLPSEDRRTLALAFVQSASAP